MPIDRITYGLMVAGIRPRRVSDRQKLAPIDANAMSHAATPEPAAAPEPPPRQPERPQASPPGEQAELIRARAQTQAQIEAALQALTPEQRQALEARARAQVALREQDLGYRTLLRLAVEALVCREPLGFDRWPALVAQLRAQNDAARGDAALEACRLEAMLEDTLVVSVPTAADQAHLTARYLGMLEALAGTPPSRVQIRVLVR